MRAIFGWEVRTNLSKQAGTFPGELASLRVLSIASMIQKNYTFGEVGPGQGLERAQCLLRVLEICRLSVQKEGKKCELEELCQDQ